MDPPHRLAVRLRGTDHGGDLAGRIADADDVGYQPFFSINYKLTDKLLLGVVYRSEMDVKLSGKLKIENIALPSGREDIKIDWKNPQWLEAGLQYRYTDRDTLYLAAGWQETRMAALEQGLGNTDELAMVLAISRVHYRNQDFDFAEEEPPAGNRGSFRAPPATGDVT